MAHLEAELGDTVAPATVNLRFPDPERWAKLANYGDHVQPELPVVTLDRVGRGHWSGIFWKDLSDNVEDAETDGVE